jgi:ABC-type ATPase involved in cell division
VQVLLADEPTGNPDQANGDKLVKSWEDWRMNADIVSLPSATISALPSVQTKSGTCPVGF